MKCFIFESVPSIRIVSARGLRPGACGGVVWEHQLSAGFAIPVQYLSTSMHTNTYKIYAKPVLLQYLKCVIPGPDQRSASITFETSPLQLSAPNSPNTMRVAGNSGQERSDSSRLCPPTLNRALSTEQQASSPRDHRVGTSPRSVRRTFSNTTPSPSVTVMINDAPKSDGSVGKSGPDMHTVWKFPSDFRFDLDDTEMKARGKLPHGPPNRAPEEQVMRY